jgi:tetratricopeptide (TPR) repeat protein
MRHTVYETLASEEEKQHKPREKLILGKDPIEEDIKKGLSLEEMRKKLEEKSHYDRILFLERLLSRKSPHLPKDTIANLGTIRTESYRFFGDECMASGDFASAAEAYSKAGDDSSASGAWKQAGDSYIGQAETIGNKPASAGSASQERKKGKVAVSLYENAAESYENAGQGELAKSAWKRAGDDYVAMADSSGDTRCLKEALRCYAKAHDDMNFGFVGLMTGMPLKEAEKSLAKSGATKDDFVLMAEKMLERQYYHAARFLYDLAGEKELAKMVAEMQSKSVKK